MITELTRIKHTHTHTHIHTNINNYIDFEMQVSKSALFIFYF